VPEPAHKSNHGLGKGLGALLSVVPRSDGEAEELRMIHTASIVPNPRQPRRSFNEEALKALVASISERGVLQPVLVRSTGGGNWELIAGERRWRAATEAGLESIPAVIRTDDDALALEVALIENMAREDLTPIEEAKACAALVDELGLTKKEVGRRVGRSRSAVSNLIRLLDLPDDVIEMLEDGRLSEGHGKALLMAPEHSERRELAAQAFRRGWSVRTTEDRARKAADGRPVKETTHPDHEAAIVELEEILERIAGLDAAVKPRGQGCRVVLDFESLPEAVALSSRLARAA